MMNVNKNEKYLVLGFLVSVVLTLYGAFTESILNLVGGGTAMLLFVVLGLFVNKQSKDKEVKSLV